MNKNELIFSHDLYTKDDADAPDCIKDRNGDIALGLCKRCGRGEADLVGPCQPIGKVMVSQVALHELLTACAGAPHMIRELQATRGVLFPDNPITVLTDEFNAQIELLWGKENAHG